MASVNMATNSVFVFTLREIPRLSGLKSSIVASIDSLIVFVLWVVSWVYALSGEMKEVPVVGVWGRKIDL